jgi:hypothetical protein
MVSAYEAQLECYVRLLVHAPSRALLRAGQLPEAVDWLPMLDQLEEFAQTLLDKRVAEFRRALPRSLRFAPQLAADYRSWLAENPAMEAPSVLPPGLSEALRARSALCSLPRASASTLAELYHFEVYAQASRIDGQVRFLTTEVPVHTLYAQLAEGPLPQEPEWAPHRYRFATDIQWKTC